MKNLSFGLFTTWVFPLSESRVLVCLFVFFHHVLNKLYLTRLFFRTVYSWKTQHTSWPHTVIQLELHKHAKYLVVLLPSKAPIHLGQATIHEYIALSPFSFLLFLIQ